MALDHGQESGSMAESRTIKTSGIRGGQCSSRLNNLYSNSNLDKPPPYEMANDEENNQSDIPLLSMAPEQVYEPPVMQRPPESRFRRFCGYMKPSPLVHFNIGPGFAFTFTTSPGFGFGFNFGFLYFFMLMVAVGFCFWAWVVWGRSQTV